jgi:hypothetical protein
MLVCVTGFGGLFNVLMGGGGGGEEWCPRDPKVSAVPRGEEV